jgi:hypothetical protein
LKVSFIAGFGLFLSGLDTPHFTGVVIHNYALEVNNTLFTLFQNRTSLGKINYVPRGISR